MQRVLPLPNPKRIAGGSEKRRSGQYGAKLTKGPVLPDADATAIPARYRQNAGETLVNNSGLGMTFGYD